MSIRATLLATALLALVACGGSGKQVATQTRPVQQSSGEETLRRQFEAAYFAIACIANHGKNPDTSITPMRRPADYLVAVEGQGTPAETRVLAILKENGFLGIPMFRNLEVRLRTDRAYWGTVEDRLIPELRRCSK